MIERKSVIFSLKIFNPLLSGVGLALSLRENGSILVWFALVPLFIIWLSSNNNSKDKNFLSGFITYFIYSVFGLSWVSSAFQNYFLTSPALSYFLMIFLCAGLSTFWGFVGFFIYLLNSRSNNLKTILRDPPMTLTPKEELLEKSFLKINIFNGKSKNSIQINSTNKIKVSLINIFLLTFGFSAFDPVLHQVFPFHWGMYLYDLGGAFPFWAQYLGWVFLGILVVFVNACIAISIVNRKISFLFLVVLTPFIFFIFPLNFDKKNDSQDSLRKDEIEELASLNLINKNEDPRFEQTSAGSKIDLNRFKYFQWIGVQGHISNEIKRDAVEVLENKMLTIDKYYASSRKALLERMTADLLIWPETALPIPWVMDTERHSNFKMDPLQEDVISFVDRIDRPILTGGFVLRADDHGSKKYSNSTLLIDPEISKVQWSPKIYLFPIGEYIPLNDFFGLTSNMFPEVPRFLTDLKPKPYYLKSETLIQTLICYEGIFTDFLRDSEGPLAVIVNLTNDSWFGSELQKRWHALMTLSQSVVWQIPVVRVTNDGLSGIGFASGKKVFYDSQSDFVNIDFKIAKDVQISAYYKEWGRILEQVPFYIFWLGVLIIVLVKKIKLST